MNNYEMIKKLEGIQKEVKYLINQLKNNNDQQMSPTQQAVKSITCSKSTAEDVKKGLETLCSTPDSLSAKQVAFVLYFAFLNKNQLGDDIDNWFGIQVGKHKYSQRTRFIEQIQSIIAQNYKNNSSFTGRLQTYLEGKKN